LQASAPRRLGASALVVGSLLAALALGYVGGTGSTTMLAELIFCVLLVASACAWTLGVPVLLCASTIDGFAKHMSDSAGVYVIKDVLLAATLIGMFVYVAMHRETLTQRSWHGLLPWALFFGYMATQIAHPALGFSGSIAGFRARAFFSILYLVGAVYFLNRERLIKMANLVIALGVVAGISAIVQHVAGDAWNRLGPGFLLASQHYSSYAIGAQLPPDQQLAMRAYGVLVDPTAMGLFLAFTILFAVAALARTNGWGRVLLLCSMGLMAAGLFYSGTRSAMVGLGAGLLVALGYMFAIRGSRRLALTAFVTIVGVAGIGFFGAHTALSDRSSSASIDYALATRERGRQIVLGELMKYPLGHGLGASAAGGAINDQGTLAVDNIYLAYLYETGIVGLAMFLLVQGSFLILALRAAARESPHRSVYIGMASGQIALLVASMATQGAFDYAPLAQIFWLFCGALSL
jgi:hypothetical protein